MRINPFSEIGSSALSVALAAVVVYAVLRQTRKDIVGALPSTDKLLESLPMLTPRNILETTRNAFTDPASGYMTDVEFRQRSRDALAAKRAEQAKAMTLKLGARLDYGGSA